MHWDSGRRHIYHGLDIDSLLIVMRINALCAPRNLHPGDDKHGVPKLPGFQILLHLLVVYIPLDVILSRLLGQLYSHRLDGKHILLVRRGIHAYAQVSTFQDLGPGADLAAADLAAGGAKALDGDCIQGFGRRRFVGVCVKAIGRVGCVLDDVAHSNTVAIGAYVEVGS